MATLVTTNFVPKNGGAFYILEDVYVKGGYRTVATLAARDATDVTCRKAGMLVYVQADGSMWKLDANLTTWSVFSAGGTGSQGPQGVQGDTGDTGAQGIQGIQGIQGSAGVGINLKGSVADVASLPASGNTQGDAYIVDADGNLYSWDGASWIDAGQIVGPQGVQGVQGVQGDAGVAGAQGVQGIQGQQGIQGVAGVDGKSAYEVAVQNGFVGTEVIWLASLKGADATTGGGSSAIAPIIFSNADLVDGKLTITHTLNTRYVMAQVYDNAYFMIIPDEVKSIDMTTLEVDLTSFVPLLGNWAIRIA